METTKPMRCTISLPLYRLLRFIYQDCIHHTDLTAFSLLLPPFLHVKPVVKHTQIHEKH